MSDILYNHIGTRKDVPKRDFDKQVVNIGTIRRYRSPEDLLAGVPSRHTVQFARADFGLGFRVLRVRGLEFRSSLKGSFKGSTRDLLGVL